MISYVIGYRNEDGSISDYVIHNQSVFHGTIEEAKQVLEMVKKSAHEDGDKYEIFKLV